jgi:hypothetical protein
VHEQNAQMPICWRTLLHILPLVYKIAFTTLHFYCPRGLSQTHETVFASVLGMFANKIPSGGPLDPKFTTCAMPLAKVAPCSRGNQAFHIPRWKNVYFILHEKALLDIFYSLGTALKKVDNKKYIWSLGKWFGLCMVGFSFYKHFIHRIPIESMYI